MICTKCSAVNDNEDRFCFKCGAPLSAADGESYSAPENEPDEKTKAANEAASLATINAQTMLAAREARKGDISAMRPFTRVAYNISESENGAAVSGLVSILYVVLGLGAVATLIKIFETISKLGESFTTSGIEGTVSEMLGKASTDNAQLLIWLILLFVVVTIGFICCGKLNIRLKKVNRKKKKEQLDSRL